MTCWILLLGELSWQALAAATGAGATAVRPLSDNMSTAAAMTAEAAREAAWRPRPISRRKPVCASCIAECLLVIDLQPRIWAARRLQIALADITSCSFRRGRL